MAVLTERNRSQLLARRAIAQARWRKRDGASIHLGAKRRNLFVFIFTFLFTEIEKLINMCYNILRDK